MVGRMGGQLWRRVENAEKGVMRLEEETSLLSSDKLCQS